MRFIHVEYNFFKFKSNLNRALEYVLMILAIDMPSLKSV